VEKPNPRFKEQLPWEWRSLFS